MYHREIERDSIGMCRRIFIVASFIKAKDCKEPSWPLTEDVA